MHARILVFLLLTVLFCRNLPAQHLQPEAVTIEHGLSQGMIFDICQTRDGFLWVATKDGLNRYDGYNFNVFSNNPFDPFSLTENTVTALFEDSRGWLWVGTDSKGLNLFDRRSRRFFHFSLNFNRYNKSASFEVVTLYEAQDGSIYVLQSGNGLVRISIPAAWEKQLPAESDLSHLTEVTLFPIEQFRFPEDEEETSLVAIETMDNGEIWVYSDKRPYVVEPTKGFVRPAGQLNQVRTIWGVVPHNLVCFQNGVLHSPIFPAGLKIRTALAKPANNGAYWLTVNRGLWYVTPGRVPDFSKPDWEMDADISAVESDRNGNIWIGTQGYGLRKINPRKQLFHKGAHGKSIWGLWRDTRDRYFCKVVNEVFPYDPATGQIGPQRAFPNGPNRVLDIHMEPSGTYWLLGRGDQEYGTAQLQRYNPDNGQYSSYPFPLDTVKSQQNDIAHVKKQWFEPYLYARLLRTRDGCLWTTSLNCRLVRFTPETTRFEQFDYTALFGEKAGTVRAFACAEDGNGVIWIGTQMGLVKCVPNGKSFLFELLQANPANPGGLNNNSIACLLPDPTDPKEILWIGTKGGGINRLDLRSGLVQHITTREGLPDNVAYGILPGGKGELWCSTNRGLAKLKPNGAEQPYDITAFTAAEGLQDNEFNTQAFFKAANGELLFGGVNGLNHFFPEAVLPDTTPPPVFIIGLRINHEPASFGNPGSPLEKPLEFLRTLRLSHAQNNLSFEFTALDFTDPAKNRYRYRLVGADPEWVETGTHRFAHFTHLSPGRYQLLVQGNNGEGDWQDAANPVSITILPPWWRSTAAYTAYVLLLLWGGWQAYQFQMRRVQMREQLAYEHRETTRIKALEQMKTNFFSNVTHEFRTPLSLMLEPSRQILANTREPETRENARHIEANSNRLLLLVNQLLDMAKLESGHIGLDLRRGDFDLTVRDVFESFLPLAEKRGIKLTLHPLHQIPPFDFDAGKVELVLNNLISNALKFTPEGGRVKIHVGGILNAADLTDIEIQIADTGIGIPPEALNKIFDRFYQVDNAHSRAGEGTGIGLALSRELAERMGGSLTVKSAPGQGATFFFRLPSLQNAGTPALDPNEPETPTYFKENTGWLANTERPIALLIEDNTELREFIKKCIAGQWQVVEASNGEEGLRKAVEQLPDIVISDVMMPLQDGYAVCEALKNNELTSHIPVILLTAKSTLDAKIKGLRTGADDYLTKPFNSEELLARMQNLVEQRRRLLQRSEQSPSAPAADLLTPPDREFLRRFTATLEQNLSDETIGVEELAQKMLISRVQLHRKLKAIANQNVTDFVRNYRLERAMSMLRNQEGLVYEVAARVGFGSEKYFSRAFKEKFGMSPSQVM